MVIVMASATRSADALINYALEDKPNQTGERYVMASGLGGLLVSIAKPQMRDVRKRWGKDRRGAFVQAYHVIQSFGVDELAPESPDSWMVAQRLGRALAEDRFAGRQVLVVTQRDGKTGCLHNHIVVNSVETRTGKSLNSSIIMHSRLVEAHERVLDAEGFEQRADLRQAFADAQDRRDRGLPSGLRRAGSNLEGETREYLNYAQWEYESEYWDENGLPRDPEPFSVDVLKWRIRQALKDPRSVDWDSFVAAGEEHGVRIEKRGIKGRGISYGMMRAQPDGTLAEPSSGDRRRGSTLGIQYEMDSVEAAFALVLVMPQVPTAAPTSSGIVLPAPAVQPKPIEQRLREAMQEIDEQFSLKRLSYEDVVAAREPAPDTPKSPQQGTNENQMPETADFASPATHEIEVVPEAPHDAEVEPLDSASSNTEPTIESPAPASLADELREINRRNHRLGMPLVSRDELEAQRAMTPEQRRLRMKYPELFDDARSDNATEQRGRRVEK